MTLLHETVRLLLSFKLECSWSLSSLYVVGLFLLLCGSWICALSLSLSSLPSCDLMSLTNMLILLHYLESFKSELAEISKLPTAVLFVDDMEGFHSSLGIIKSITLNVLANIHNDIGRTIDTACEPDDVQQVFKMECVLRDFD
ncbi:hypothetical protein Tco_0693423 [Tanacetum coccineum]